MMMLVCRKLAHEIKMMEISWTVESEFPVQDVAVELHFEAGLGTAMGSMFAAVFSGNDSSMIAVTPLLGAQTQNWTFECAPCIAARDRVPVYRLLACIPNSQT
jgi:hypothetical protein